MAAKFIQISPEIVGDTAKKTETSRAGFRASYINIYRDVEVMKAVHWLGSASESFIRQINAYRNDFEQLDSYLGELTVYLTKVSQDFIANELNLADDALRLPNLEIAPF